MFMFCIMGVVEDHVEVQATGIFVPDTSKPYTPSGLSFGPVWNLMWSSYGPAVAAR